MSQLDLLLDAAEGLPHTQKSMFGGHGLFAQNGQMFAAELKGEIALRIVDEAMNAELAALGGKPFNPLGRMPKGMANWLVVPDAMLDEPAELREWVRRAQALAKTGAPKATKRPNMAPPKRAKKAAPTKPTKKARGKR